MPAPAHHHRFRGAAAVSHGATARPWGYPGGATTPSTTASLPVDTCLRTCDGEILLLGGRRSTRDWAEDR